MARICQTRDGARIGSAGSRAGSWGRQALRTAYGTVSDRRCRRPTTVAAVAASRSTRSTSGGQGDHGRGGGAPASFQRRGCPGRHGMRVGNRNHPKAPHTRAAAPRMPARIRPCNDRLRAQQMPSNCGVRGGRTCTSPTVKSVRSQMHSTAAWHVLSQGHQSCRLTFDPAALLSASLASSSSPLDRRLRGKVLRIGAPSHPSRGHAFGQRGAQSLPCGLLVAVCCVLLGLGRSGTGRSQAGRVRK